MKKNSKNNITTEIKKFGFNYLGIDDDGMEYGEYIEFPDLLSFNSYLNKVLCRSDRHISLYSVYFYINGKMI